MQSNEIRIFVTGATGFVGSHIVALLLAEGYKNITCLTRRDVDPTFNGFDVAKVSWISGDILDSPLLEECLNDTDVVIHTAAMVTFSTENKKKQLEIARTGTANIVNASITNGVQKMIHISSVAAIGRKKQIEDIDEKVIYSHSKYDTTYGLSKFLSEQEVWRGHAEGLPVTILNPSMILGVGNWDKTSVQIFKKVYHGLPYYPAGTTGWVDVQDVANAALKSVKADYNGERFIISAENIPYEQVMSEIASHLQVKAPSKALSPALFGVAWRLEAIRSFFSRKPPVITRETIYSTSVQSHYDNSKSVRIMAMTYRPVSQTIQEVSKAFLQTYQMK